MKLVQNTTDIPDERIQAILRDCPSLMVINKIALRSPGGVQRGLAPFDRGLGVSP